MLPRFNYHVKRESRIRKVLAKNVSAVKGQMIAGNAGEESARQVVSLPLSLSAYDR